MRSRLPARWFFGAMLLLAGCVRFRADLDTDREVRIVEVSPQDGEHTGLRQKFSVMIFDEDERPAQLKVYASVDEGPRVACRFDPEPTNTIDESRQENIFRCPVDTASLAPGEHAIRYSVVDRDRAERDETTRVFDLDGEAPDVELHTGTLDGEPRLTWRVWNDEDFVELGVFVNGVRIFTSGSVEGEAALARAVLGGAREVEVRAYDRVHNEFSHVLTLP